MNFPAFKFEPPAGRFQGQGAGQSLIRAAGWVALAVLAMWPAPMVRAADATNASISILVLERGDNRPTYADFMYRLRQVLTANLSNHVVVYRENLDLTRFGGSSYRSELEEWLRNKYRGRKLDVIVASGETPIDFILKVRPQLWPQVPVVAIGPKGMETTLLAGQTNVTGITLDIDVSGTLKTALWLCPDTRRIAFVSSAESDLPELHGRDLKKVEDFCRNRFELIKLVGLTMSGTKQRLATLPAKTIVFYDDIWVDASGQIFEPRDALEELNAVSRAPIFSYADTYVGFGMTGGSCIAYRTLATEAAGQIAAVVRAGSANAVPVIQSAGNQLAFDSRQLQKYGLDEKRIPPGSTVRFHTPTLWEAYRQSVMIVMAALIVQTVSIGALLLQRRRKWLAEAELFSSRRMLRTVLDTIPQHVFWKDRNSVYLGCNQAMANDCGFSNPGELAGKTDAETTLAAKAEQHRADDREVMETGRPKLFFEEMQVRPDGSTGWVRTNKVPLYDQSGQVIGVLGTREDITDRKRAREQLEQSLSLLRTTLESTADGILVVNLQGKISTYNQKFKEMFHVPDAILQTHDNKPLLDFVLNQMANPEAFLAKVRELYSHPEIENYDVVESKDGRTFERYSHPQRIGNKVVGRVWSFSECTERKQLEERLRQSQKMEAFGQLAGGVAHDFNNLLTVIQGNVTLLQLQESTHPEQKTGLNEIAKASERAANLTRQLLTFSRRQLFQPKPLDLNEVVANTTNMLQRLIGEHIGLEAHFAPGGAPVMADRNMMEQILVNLAVNSRDAMPKGGRLLIQTAMAEISETEAQANPKVRAGSFIRLEVTDNGCGIAPEQLERIFEPFFTTKEVGKGTGLGLATVFGIVIQHHGWIEVKSLINQGTTFQIFLSRHVENAKALEAPSPAPVVRGGSETILLVEDEAPVRSLARTLLEQKGYRILEADSGVSAMEVWREHHNSVDLLLTDMVMPNGISGRELAERLCSEKPGLKVVYCSGYTDEMLGENSPLRNNPNFMEKPFSPHKLLKQVRDCLDGVTRSKH